MTAARSDWDPYAPLSGDNQTRHQDEIRARCPVAHSEALGWSLFRHRDVMQALTEHAVFGNQVSARRAVPNGMDPPEHTEFRRVIEPFFSAARMRSFEPRCRAVAGALIAEAGPEVEVMSQLAEDFALRAQCGFLGWSADLHGPLREWIHRNHEAIRTRDRRAITAVATEFDEHIRAVLARCRAAEGLADDDVTTQLMSARVFDRKLTDEEIVSILRNWTVGELGTIAASIGILMHYLATHPPLQRQLRENPLQLAPAIDEILRIETPLMKSRRVTTQAIEIGGQRLPEGERVALMWGSANRDEEVFGDPDEFRLDRDPSRNLLYGAGIHVCPGAPLARLELRVFIEELFAQTRAIRPVAARPPARATYPAGGFASVWVNVTRS